MMASLDGVVAGLASSFFLVTVGVQVNLRALRLISRSTEVND
jgi:hypothetical protein